MELSAAALKRQLLKENYPQNLVLAIIDTWQLEGPKEYTQDIIAGIHYAISTLSDREQQLIYLRYADRYTLKEIGSVFSVKQERARQIESAALRKLRSRRNWMYITNGIEGYTKILCKCEYDKGHQIGYNSGYKQGLKDAPKGITKAGLSINITSLPVESLNLSTRSLNCLKSTGLSTVGDLINLSCDAIIHIKNLGTKQRQEVAVGLSTLGIVHTEWDLWLMDKATK